MSESDADDAKRLSNEPRYHHYIPQFYLSRWANSERKICRFSKPYDRIVPKMVGVKGTGGQDDLYSMKSPTAVDAQWMEKGPMKIIDTAASESLRMLEAGDDRIRTDTYARSAWSCFLMSMMMRGPKDLEILKASLAAEWAKHLPEMKADLQAIYGERGRYAIDAISDPDSSEIEDWALRLSVNLMDHRGIGQVINNMRWFVKDVPEGPELLTSDRPIRFSGSLSLPDDYIIMPIGPRKLFVATTTLETGMRAWKHDPVQQAAGVNKHIVARAQRWVYGSDDSQLEFVREHISTKPEKPLFQLMNEFRQQAEHSLPPDNIR